MNERMTRTLCIVAVLGMTLDCGGGRQLVQDGAAADGGGSDARTDASPPDGYDAGSSTDAGPADADAFASVDAMADGVADVESMDIGADGTADLAADVASDRVESSPDSSVADAAQETAPPVCGNRTVEAGETCDYGNEGEFCRMCLATCRAACPWPRQPDPCAQLSGDEQIDCYALLNCMARGLSLCVYTVQQGVYGPQGCYCSDSTCSKGADGQCAAEFQAVTKTMEPAEVIRQLNDPTTTVAKVGEMAKRYGNSSFCILGCMGRP
jgi:hypothetical protein